MAHPSIPDNVPYEVRCWQDERRAHPRLRCKGVAEVRVLSVDSNLPGTLLDLSVAGCCIETNSPMPPIENPMVEVQLNVNSDKLRVKGVVRNLRGDCCAGIEFIDVTPRKAEQIKGLVKELLEREFDCRADLQSD